ncbi:hypothetical protein ACH5RR_030270 [Cinchona calisaya]|uniref:Chromo domain-containing protein n=1 Tax=Cinchona calisaya TaxID=153742 RepID=A0ABD2YU34_9GENT
MVVIRWRWGEMIPKSVAVLDRRQVKRGLVPIVQVLVQWSNSFAEDATWEDYDNIHLHFPQFFATLENKGIPPGGGNLIRGK